MSTPKLVVMHPTVGSYRRPPGCALHLTHVEKKVAEAVRPDPVALDDALLEENIGEPPSQALSIEILFTAVGSLPGLRGCARLQELTLMHARLARVPPELQSVRHTLQRLSLANNEIGRIEHLDGMVHLHTLFLQENSLEVIDGLGDCVALQRLWLSANRISALGDGLRPLHELRELWLQANPLQSAHELGALASLQVLSLAATEIASVDALEPLRGLRSLYDLSFDDLMFGAAPLADLSLRHWDQDDAHAYGGQHCAIREGYAAIGGKSPQLETTQAQGRLLVPGDKSRGPRISITARRAPSFTPIRSPGKNTVGYRSRTSEKPRRTPATESKPLPFRARKTLVTSRRTISMAKSASTPPAPNPCIRS